MKFIKKLCAVLLGLLVGLIVAELAARTLLPYPKRQIALLRMRAPDLQMDAGTDLKHPGYNPFLQRRPNGEWICDGVHPEKMNNEGFRDKDFIETKPAGKKRIAMIGDSFTEGWMGPRDAAFPRVVESQLGSSAEVMNFGLANRSPLRYVALYDQIVRKYHPDTVAIFLYQNDLQEDEALRPYVTFDAYGVPSNFDYERYFKNTPRMPQTRWERRRDRWQWMACQWSRLYPYAAIFGIDPEFRRRILNAPPLASQESLWPQTASYLRTLRDLVQNDHARFILAYALDLSDFTTSSVLLKKSSEFASDEKIPFFGAPSMMKEKQPQRFYVPGDGHFSVEGNRKYGTEFVRWLKKEKF